SAVNISRRLDARAGSADTTAPFSEPSQKPPSPISVSSAPTRSLTPAGSKTIWEQLQLIPDRSKPLRRGLGGGVGGHLGTMAALELLTRSAPARVIAAYLMLVVDDPLLDHRNRFPAHDGAAVPRGCFWTDPRRGGGCRERAGPDRAASARV